MNEHMAPLGLAFPCILSCSIVSPSDQSPTASGIKIKSVSSSRLPSARHCGETMPSSICCIAISDTNLTTMPCSSRGKCAVQWLIGENWISDDVDGM